MFTSPFFKIHLNTPLPEKFRSPNWRITTFEYRTHFRLPIAC